MAFSILNVCYGVYSFLQMMTGCHGAEVHSAVVASIHPHSFSTPHKILDLKVAGKINYKLH